MVLAHQPEDVFRFVCQAKRQVQDASPYQFEYRCLTAGQVSDQMAGFGQDGFAGNEWRGNLSPLIRCPPVMPVTAVQQGNEWAGIQDDLVYHRPKFRR